jgi:hypothetical protein
MRSGFAASACIRYPQGERMNPYLPGEILVIGQINLELPGLHCSIGLDICAESLPVDVALHIEPVLP